MTIYVMGNHPVDFNNTGVVQTNNTVNNAYGDPGYTAYPTSPAGCTLGTYTSPYPLGGLTDVWAGFTMGNTIGSASEDSTVTIFELRTSGGQGIVRLQNTSGPTRTFQYWNGSAWTNIGTLSNSSTRMGRRIDIRCKIHGSTGEFRIYVDRVLQQSLTGNTDFFSATIDDFAVNGWGQFNGRSITELCIASEDTRKIRIKGGYFTGDSATNTGWTGGFANLNETPTSDYTTADADASVSSASGQDMSFTKPALGNFGDDGAILAVSVSARAKNDGSSADFDLLVRSGGTNYTAGHGRTINTTNTNGYAAIWNTDPATGVAWTKSGVDNCELGMRSKNAGGSTIYLMTYCVAIRDDFIEPWESTYPNASTDGIAMVEVTAPGSTGYVDVTVPDMVSDGCSPSFALLMTNGGTSNAANPSAQMHVGFVSNQQRSDLAAKGGIGFTSADASASSSTQRLTQNRTKLDFASSNGGWLIDASGLRVRFQKFIKGGVRLFYETTTSGRKFSVMFFWGAELKVQYWTTNLGTGTGAQAQTGIGFQPDAGIFFSAGNSIGNTTTGYFSFGVAADDGGGLLQRALMRYSPSGNSAGPAPIQIIDDTVIGGLINPTGPAISWDLTLNSFDADGFTVQASASAGSATLYSILLHHTGGRKFKVIDFTTPTVTGTTLHTGAGFTPCMAIGAVASLQAVNSLQSDVEQASSCSIFASDPDLAMCSVTLQEDTVLDPADCNSYQDTAHLVRLGTNGSNTVSELVGALSAYGTDGINVNYTTASATQKKGFTLLFEGTAGGPPVGVGASGGLIIVCM